MERLSVVGLGKLGACTAACFAAKGHQVVGIDVDQGVVDAVNAGRPPVVEPRLGEMMAKAKGRLRATRDWEQVVRGSDVTFLIVPTPSKEDGSFSNKFVEDALARLASAQRKLRKERHLYVVTSTVSPGASRSLLIPLIERALGRKLGRGFGYAYNPEFIALGSVVTDFLNPDMVLIGESDPVVGKRLEAIYRGSMESRPRIARMSIESAEITKISLNSYVTMKISFANTLANVCERVPGSDVDDISGALGADRRISPFYIKGGLSFGGPCFPRDNRAFAAFAAGLGLDADLAKATDRVNGLQVRLLAEKVLAASSGRSRRAVAVLGLAYKKNTPVIEESAAIKLVDELVKSDVEVIVYDRLAMEQARAHFGEKVLYAASVRDALANSSVCVIATPEEEFKDLGRSRLLPVPDVVIDCWRMLDRKALRKGVRYLAVGTAASASRA